jgi:hypothetical protein
MTTRPEDLVRERDVQWQTVSSSNVHSALFAANQDFYVRFLRSGPDDIYRYPGRSPDEWDDFRTATSKGGWIWDNPIADNWPYDLLTTRAFADVAREDLPAATRKFLD